MVSDARLSISCFHLAVVLCVAAVVGHAAGSPGAGEPRDEKGRTAADVAEEIRVDQEASALRQARKARALEAGRQALFLPSDPGECLAYHRVERRCLVTAGDFNRRMAADAHWAERLGDLGAQAAPLLRLRKELLAGFLEESYQDALAATRDKAGKPAEEAWRAHLDGMLGAAGDQRLRALYRKHAASFGPGREVQAEFLGASDSSFLDSLVGCELEHPPAAPAAPLREVGGRAGRCASGRPIQWGRLEAGDLPGEMPRIVDTLRQGEVSGIVRGGFGWFVIAAVRVREIPAKTYEESRPLLAYLAEIPDPPADARPGDLPAEDPHLRAWLLPRFGTGKTSGKSRRPIGPAWADTALLGSQRLRLSDLPAGMGCQALASLRKDGRGILRNRFGTWYLESESPPSAARNGAATDCAPEEPPAGGIVALAAANLASKEKAFKGNILETEARTEAPSGPGVGGPPSLREKWIAENVSVENTLLERLQPAISRRGE